MTLPGAGPPTAAERALAALKSQSVNTARGEVQTRSSRRRPPTEPYHAPPLGFAPIAAVRFVSYDHSTPLDGATMDYDQFGNGADFFTYSAPIDVFLNATGWYQTSFSLSLNGMTPGDLGYLEIDCPGPEIYLSTMFFGNSFGFGFGYVSTMPFYVDFVGGSCTYRSTLPSGAFVQSDAYLLKLA